MIRHLQSALLFLSLAVPAFSAQAGELRGVVELFTSQGCSSCPRADAELGRLVEEGDILALSYHVDYWNYLGWKDTLSDAANTERQKGYARTLGSASVYTPQAVVNGRDHANGGDDAAIKALLAGFEKKGMGLTVDVGLKRSGDTIDVTIGEMPAGGDAAGRAEIVVAYFDKANTVEIPRGENRGKRITYHHSVRNFEIIGMWSGEQMEIKLPRSVLGEDGQRGCAIILQRMDAKGRPGAILGAAMLASGEAG
ncbi:DUF1223 domain-containing protein [Pseudohoeflea suaedae]|uniref:DUF1223 domain-containing protein n=1 Tax=Pseudohoeflea suaedae TaxID=877384 RepID=A0A4R5PMF3_9HYPH|nr:DUF1223 domain-containing protein [Pseudohoeflea suaedae]TDH37711.1 DUF1223 domain-containing protein [Pseudohoeflea suaedae]